MAADKSFPFKIVIRGVDRVTGVLSKVQGSIDKVGERVAAISKRTGLSALNGSVKKLGAQFRSLEERSGLPVLRASIVRVGQALHKTGEAMGRVVEWGKRLAVVGGLVAASGAVMFKSFLDQTGHLNDLKGQVGVNIEKFQEWTYAAKLNGVEQDKLAVGIRMLNYNIGQAVAGTGVAKNVFQALGISLKDAKGHVKGAEQVLPELADKLQKIHSAALRASIAQTLMSESGQKLLPMLVGGSKGLAALGAEARAVGFVMDQKTIDAGDRLGDTLTKLGAVLEGVRNRIGAALIPILQKLTVKLIVLAEKYGPMISKWAQGFAATLPARLSQLKDLFAQLWAKIQPLVKGVAWMVKTFGAANVILGVVGTMVAATVLPAMVALTTAVYTLGAAILTTPIGWILGLIAALAAAAYLVYKNWAPISIWLGDNLFEPFFKALDAVGSAVGTAWKVVKAIFMGEIGAVRAYFMVYFKVGEWIGGKIRSAAKFIGGILDKYGPGALIRQGLEGLMNWLSNFNLGQVIRDKVAAIASYLPDWLTKKLGIADIAAASRQQAGAAGAAVGAAGVARNAAVAQNGTVQVKVDFNNLPKGARVSTERRGQADFEMNQGFAMGSF